MEATSPERLDAVLSALGKLDAQAQASLLTVPGKLESWLAAALDNADPEVSQSENGPTQTAECTSRPQVRPIQMGEFLRKFTCKRLLTLDKKDIAAASASMRQFGCGINGGA